MWIASTAPRSAVAAGLAVSVGIPSGASRRVVIADSLAGRDRDPTRGSRRPGILWAVGERTIEGASGAAPRPVTADAEADGLWSPARRALTIGLVLNVTIVASEALAVSTIMP